MICSQISVSIFFLLVWYFSYLHTLEYGESNSAENRQQTVVQYIRTGCLEICTCSSNWQSQQNPWPQEQVSCELCYAGQYAADEDITCVECCTGRLSRSWWLLHAQPRARTPVSLVQQSRQDLAPRLFNVHLSRGTYTGDAIVECIPCDAVTYCLCQKFAINISTPQP
jgi:hypothetical protein